MKATETLKSVIGVVKYPKFTDLSIALTGFEVSLILKEASMKALIIRVGGWVLYSFFKNKKPADFSAGHMFKNFKPLKACLYNIIPVDFVNKSRLL